MQVALSSVEYTKYEDKPVVHLFGRDETLTRRHIRVYNLYPFFYINKNVPVPKNNRIIKIKKEGWHSIDGNEVKKIEVKLPEDVGGNRKDKQGLRVRFTKTYEDDILFHNRAKIELGIKSGFEVDKRDFDYGYEGFKPIEFKQELRRLHIDIESSTVETGGRMPRWKNPVNTIYSISNFDSYDLKLVTFIWHYNYKNKKKYKSTYKVPFKVKKNSKLKQKYPFSIWTFNNEKDMLNEWLDYVQDKNPDIITGWNARGFDIPYIIERMKRLKVPSYKLSPLHSVYIDKDEFSHIKGRIVFDTWQGYVKTLTKETEGNKLDMVAMRIFKIGKVKHQGIDKMWRENRNLLILYNGQDTFLDYAIAEDQGVFSFFYDVMCYAGCSYEDVLNNSRIVDMYMLFKAKDRKIVLPSRIGREKEGFGGGKVFQAPKKGVQEWVCVIDLKSLYPMIMLSLNMGEDTIVYDPPEHEIPNLIKTPINKVYFRKDKESFIANILRELIDYRDELKKLVKKYEKSNEIDKSKIYDRIQTVVKFITNSIYGVIGWVEFRLYNKKISANVTAVGRIVIEYTLKVCERIKYRIYYGDTDSVFPLLKNQKIEECIPEIIELTKILNKQYNVFKKVFNIDKHYFLMKPEKIYRTLFMVRKKGEERVAKKRYAGIIIWEDKGSRNPLDDICDELEVKGFDRSDMSRVGNKLMKNVLEKACYGISIEEIENYVKNEVKNVKKGKYPLIEIGYSTGIKKPLSTYGNQDWIRGARWTNKYSSYWNAQTEFGAGSKPKFVYLKVRELPAPYHPDDYVRKSKRKYQIVALDDEFYLPPHLSEIIDYKKLIQKTIKLKLETILEAIGTSWDNAVSNRKLNSLKKYGDCVWLNRSEM